MDVVYEIPVGLRALSGNAVRVNGSVHGPRVDFGQWIIFVDKADFVLVAIERLREQGRVHARAVGALQVVEVDHGHFGGWISTDRATGYVDIEDRILCEVEGLEARQLCVVG